MQGTQLPTSMERPQQVKMQQGTGAGCSQVVPVVSIQALHAHCMSSYTVAACECCCCLFADAHQLAHYIMLRFGEDLRAKVAAARKEQVAQPLEPAQPRQESGFSIPGVHGPHETDSLVERDRTLQAGGNGQRLAGRIRVEAEQAGVQAALSSLLELHQGLREQQQQMLSLQRSLLQQQAEVVQALGCEGREGEGLQLPSGPGLAVAELGAAEEQRREGRWGVARRGQLHSLGSLAAVSLHRQAPGCETEGAQAHRGLGF